MRRERCAAPGCQRYGVHRHHVVYKQHCRIAGASVKDQRNVLLLCPECHFNHHARAKVMPIAMLTQANWEFAREALGEYAADYLHRYYATDH